MTDGIYGIGHGNSSGVGNSYVPQRKNNALEEKTQAQAQEKPNYEETQVDPNKVMDFLVNNNYFVPVNTGSQVSVNVDAVDADTQERIAGYMERFEEIYSVVEQEFGAELSPMVMDFVMDKLMGM